MPTAQGSVFYFDENQVIEAWQFSIMVFVVLVLVFHRIVWASLAYIWALVVYKFHLAIFNLRMQLSIAIALFMSWLLRLSLKFDNDFFYWLTLKCSRIATLVVNWLVRDVVQLPEQNKNDSQ
jgi:hypothetical protein